MRQLRLKFPKLCLSTILIEIGIICALVAVNTRPLSYGSGTFVEITTITTPTNAPPSNTTSGYDSPGPHTQVYDKDSVIVKYTFIGDLDGDTDLGDWNPRVANYGWPLKSVEIASETREVHYVHKKRLAANIAICLAIIVCSALAIEWSIRFANRARKPIATID